MFLGMISKTWPTTLSLFKQTRQKQPLSILVACSRIAPFLSSSDTLMINAVMNYQGYIPTHITCNSSSVNMTFFCFFCFSRDLQRIGVSLAGHQKKILTSVQSMRHNVDDQSPTESV